MSEDHSSGLSRFFTQASKLPLLTATQEVELAERRDKGDKRAEQKLVEHNIRLAISIAKHWRNRGLPLEDLVQEGMLGLHRAATKFDPSKGNRFSTYASWWVTHFVQRAVQNTGQTIRTPGHVTARRLTLENHLMEFPDTSHEELAVIAKCTVDEVQEALDAGRISASLDSLLDDSLSAHEILADPNAVRPDEIVVQDRRVRDALGKLGELERRVLELRFGFDGPVRKRADVAEILEVSQRSVQHAQKVALLRLRELLHDERMTPITSAALRAAALDKTEPICSRPEPAPC